MSEHGTYCCETCRAEGWRCPAPCARPCCAATQPEQGTASVEALLAEVLRECDDPTGWVWNDGDALVYECGCGDTSPALTTHLIGPKDVEDAAEWHRAHVASAQAAALAGMLPVTAPGSSNLQQTLEQAEAALAALRTQLRDCGQHCEDHANDCATLDPGATTTAQDEAGGEG